MAEITASLVKDLRERTGAGMMDCKKALTETGGDFEGAVDWLRTKGLAAAAKKAGRTAAEGLVGVAVNGRRGAAVEVNSETDFVAKNALFQDFVRETTQIALAEHIDDVDRLAAAEMAPDSTVAGTLTDNIAKIGENQSLRRVALVEVEKGRVFSYVHNAAAPGLGKIGVLVAIESAADAERFDELGRQLAMHVAAASPLAVEEAGVDPAVVERERAIAREKAAQSGKPAEIVEKMVEGGVKKFIADATLMGQVFVIDGKTRVADVLAQASKDLGSPVRIKDFVRFQLGEGIDRGPSDFAAEVAEMAGL